ncbi:FAD-dependent oxidoreductase [Streptomyces sp. NPDC057301]|uniref:FAD-dependent oxidoreductase n=1 Tax=Streptomyces sp. NPDC057301 TaxID=3346093 RepID=UPI00363D9B54
MEQGVAVDGEALRGPRSARAQHGPAPVVRGRRARAGGFPPAGRTGRARGGAPERGAGRDGARSRARRPGAGFLVERQWAVDPGQFVDTLAERLRRDGAELVEGARVTAVGEDADRVEVRTAAGTYTADAVVIAAGVWSRDVCASLGVRIEMAAGTMEFDRDPDRFRQGR